VSEFLPRPSDEILELVQACGEHLRNLDSSAVQKAFQPPEAGSHATEPTPAQLKAVYDTACQLCDEGNFRFAAALAMHLVAHKPVDPRFAFMAGTCMQHLGLHTNATQFFCIALVSVAMTRRPFIVWVNPSLRWATRRRQKKRSMPPLTSRATGSVRASCRWWPINCSN
jgi:hypothetical protein